MQRTLMRRVVERRVLLVPSGRELKVKDAVRRVVKDAVKDAVKDVARFAVKDVAKDGARVGAVVGGMVAMAESGGRARRRLSLG
jgi:hypothetical protein